jgi:hypothetical protein
MMKMQQLVIPCLVSLWITMRMVAPLFSKQRATETAVLCSTLLLLV